MNFVHEHVFEDLFGVHFEQSLVPITSFIKKNSKVKIKSGEYYTISSYASNYCPQCISVSYDTNDKSLLSKSINSTL